MMDVRELLRTWRVRFAWTQELNRALEALEIAKEDIYLSTSSGSNAGSQRTEVSDPTSRLASVALRYDRLIEQKEDELRAHLHSYDLLEASIQRLPDIHRRIIDLRYRGARQHTWEEIQKMVCYSARSVYRFHDEALDLLENACNPHSMAVLLHCNSSPAVVM